MNQIAGQIEELRHVQKITTLQIVHGTGGGIVACHLLG